MEMVFNFRVLTFWGHHNECDWSVYQFYRGKPTSKSIELVEIIIPNTTLLRPCTHQSVIMYTSFTCQRKVKSKIIYT